MNFAVDAFFTLFAIKGYLTLNAFIVIFHYEKLIDLIQFTFKIRFEFRNIEDWIIFVDNKIDINYIVIVSKLKI